jgi:hypothetical protein
VRVNPITLSKQFDSIGPIIANFDCFSFAEPQRESGLGTDRQFGTSCQTPKLLKWPYLLLIRTAD